MAQPGDDGLATPLTAPPGAALARPTGLVGQGASLSIADTGNSRVLRLATGTGTWDRFGGDGRAPGRFVAPTCVAVSPDGATLVVADGGNHRIQRFTLSGAPGPVARPVDVALAGGGRGAVTSDLAGIACPPDWRQAFSPGATLTLTASPAAGSAFAGWSGACTGTGPCRLTVGAAPAGATATFELVGPAAPGPLPSPVPPPPAGSPPAGSPPARSAPTPPSRASIAPPRC